MSNLSEEHIKDAINNGIDAEAVNATLGDMIENSNKIGSTPKQAKEVVETIVEMKKETPNKIDESYESDFVKENNEKIKNAINDGISSSEIAATLIDFTKKANDRKSKKHLKFITKLIEKMKKKELKLRKSKENQIDKEKQKVFFKS